MNGLTQRIDVLDLIIEVLAGHEKDLDEQIGRLKGLLERLALLFPQ